MDVTKSTLEFNMLVSNVFSVFFACLFSLLYTLVFFISADTPLSIAPWGGVVFVASLTVLISAIVSLISGVPLYLAVLVSPGKERVVNKVGATLVFLILFCGFLLLIENFAYSLFGMSLKTEVSWISKLLFILGGAFLAQQFTSVLLSLGTLTKAHNIAVWMVIGVVLAAFTSQLAGARVNKLEPNLRATSGINKLNVVILLSDGINAADMSIYESKENTTPFLKSIAAELMVFENAFYNSQNTTGSLASIITGISPLSSKVVFPPDIMSGAMAHRSLPKLLGEFGYYRALWGVPYWVDAESLNMVGAFDRNIIRNPITSKGIVSAVDNIADLASLDSLQRWFFRSVLRDFTGVLGDVTFLQEMDNPFAYVASNDSAKNLSDRLRLKYTLLDIEESSEADQPFYILTHFMKTHGGYYRPKSRHFSAGMVENEPRMIEFYQDAVLDFDKAIEKIYSKLQSENELENTVLIIGSDHTRRGSDHKRLPILIRVPDASNAGVYDVNVQLLDIAPTIVELLGFSKPDWMNGDSLMFPDRLSPTRYILGAEVEGSNLRKLDQGGLVRVDPDERFRYNNKFSVVYCNYFMTSNFPISFKPERIIGMKPHTKCDDEQPIKVAEEAKYLIEEKVP